MKTNLKLSLASVFIALAIKTGCESSGSTTHSTNPSNTNYTNTNPVVSPINTY